MGSASLERVKGVAMLKDTVEGKSEEIKGVFTYLWGKLTRSNTTKIRGIGSVLSGLIHEKVGHLKDSIKKASQGGRYE